MMQLACTDVETDHVHLSQGIFNASSSGHLPVSSTAHSAVPMQVYMEQHGHPHYRTSLD